MRPDTAVHRPDEQAPDDVGTPTLLLVAVSGILAAVAAVVLAGAIGTTLSVVAAIVIVLVGLTAVTATITRQLGQ
jgi:hypothetical protein